MSAFFSGIGTILSLELRQRVRGVAAWVLLGIFVVLVAMVTGAVWVALTGFGTEAGAGAGIYSTVIYFVLLLGTLVTPALSGNAINGDRDAGTLATTQVTLITTWQLILGKFLASWITALAFLVAALPFLLLSLLSGDVYWDTILVSVVILALELAVVAAVGVGLSAIIQKPLFSIVTTYLIVATLSVGTLIAFGLGGLTTQTEVKSTYIGLDYPADGSEPDYNDCLPPEVTTYPSPRYDLWWPILAANPYVVLADASPSNFDSSGQPQDLFSIIKVGVRSVQLPPDLENTYDECGEYGNGYIDDYPSGEEIVAKTVPSWFVGLLIHVLLGGGLLVWGWARTRTPAKLLTKGSRIA
jgi:ABC-type transport system involved in multi-copper enzyme maturation permease subunit